MINQIFNEDCLEGMKRIPDESIDLVVTDPPYRLVGGGQTTKGMGGAFNRSNQNSRSGKVFDHNEIDFSEWLPEVYRVLKDKSHFYCFINSGNFQEVLNESTKLGFILNNILVMLKDNTVVNQWYMKNCEYVLFLRKGGAKALTNNSNNTVTPVSMPKDLNKIHPTQKPTNYLEMLIKNSSNENDTVLDPFCGSGSTAVACMNTNRNFVTFELDENFYKSSTARINEQRDFLNGQLLF